MMFPGMSMSFWHRLLFLLVLVCQMVQARRDDDIELTMSPMPYTLEDSSVACLDVNRLTFPVGHQMFDSLYTRLRGLICEGDASLRVLHIGGSHVQAGVFSGRMRSNMQSFATSHESAGLGMTFPFSVLGTNGPREYTYESTGKWEKCRNLESSPVYSLGLSGAVIATGDLASTLTFRSSRPFESVLVYGGSLSDTAWVYPVMVAGEDTLYSSRGSGDMGYEFLFSQPVNECTLALAGDSCGGFIFRGLVVDPYMPGLLYSASGINGAAVPSWLRCELLERELQPIAPDLVLLAIGINDANVVEFSPERFKQNYRELLDRIRRCNPQCAFLFITNNDCYLNVGRRKKTYNKNTEKVERAFLELAEEYHGAVWNLYRIMGGYGSSGKWVKAGLMRSDHIHFTSRGYELLGDMLYNAILEDMSDGLSLLVPEESDTFEEVSM